MSKLMEHGNHIAEADQRRLTRRRLGKVRNVVHHGRSPQQPRLADKVRHPGAAILVVALEVIAVKKREVLAVGVENLKHAHIGLVDRQVVPFLKVIP